jgi:3-phosphoshikimate 1-carboxyvinyltransferase
MSPASILPTPLTAERSPWLRGPVSLPGDPLFSALALILAAMARGESVLENLSAAPSTAAVAAVLAELGANVVQRGSRWHVQGIGVGSFLAPRAPLEMAATGGAAPLLVGLLGAHAFTTEFKGLGQSPDTLAILDFLLRNGALVEHEGALIRVRAPRFGIPLDMALSGAGQGLVAPMLLHAVVTVGRSHLRLPAGAHDAAIDFLAAFGAKINTRDEDDVLHVELEGLAPLRAQVLTAPGDPHLAIYPAAAAAVAPDSELTIASVALHPRGLALLDALALLGSDIAIGETGRGSADVIVRHAPLVGTIIPADLGVSHDDFPILAIAAAFAEGETLLEGLGEGVRRLALTRALRANGVECVEQPGGLLIRGRPRVPGGGNVVVRLDPKLAMAFLVLGMAADRAVTIENGAAMAELFPDFVLAFEHVGASFSAGLAA